MKNWRPSGWDIDKILRGVPQLCDKNGNIYTPTENKLIAEAVADAMLEALRRYQAVETLDTTHLKLFGGKEWIKWHLKGLMVFIPNEEK